MSHAVKMVTETYCHKNARSLLEAQSGIYISIAQYFLWYQRSVS